MDPYFKEPSDYQERKGKPRASSKRDKQEGEA
jgi:hypothetical protein